MMRAAIGVSCRDFLTFLVTCRLGGFIINMPQQDSKTILKKNKKHGVLSPVFIHQKTKTKLGFKLIMSNLKCFKKLNCKPEVERKGCCMSSSICLFSVTPPLFFSTPFSSLSSHSSRCLMSVMTKRSYWTLSIPHISPEKARSIDRPGGIDVSSRRIQTSSKWAAPCDHII